MINRVLIVCVGNICRSPMAESALRHRLGGNGVAVESAGLAALAGSPVDPLAESVLAEHGLSAKSHVARQVDVSLISAADVVLAMDRRHLSAIHALVPHARGKTFLLGKWQGDIEIADPYGRQRQAFEQAYRMIDEAVDSWRSHL
ncbi:MAG: low molecular weight phosphotyrosine protein phosphatase [Luteimonas sp.]|nr:low molecular weight phosphotyrosine protein phosphatase [Luteimonas sp.]